MCIVDLDMTGKTMQMSTSAPFDVFKREEVVT